MSKIGTIVILIFSCLFLVGALYAGDTGKISGVLTDAETGDALPGANIVVESKWSDNEALPLENPTGTSTDIDGTYYIINLPPGFYNVRATYIGYRDELRTRVEVSVDKTTRVSFQMKPQALESDAVVVTAYAPARVEKDVTATKQVYDVAEISSIAGVADVNDILSLQADVVDDHFRGGRVGESLYLMSGGSIVNPLNNQRAFSPIVTGLEQVEVYTSGFSAEYGNAQSGVVNMVTKEGGSKWQSRMEVASTLPYYKSWNGSPYSPENLDFYQLLKNTEEWLKENPTQPGRPLFDAGYGFGTTYLPERIVWPPKPLTRSDSLKIAELGQILWLQSVRDVGLKYKNKTDYRVDFTTGGPIAENANIFVAARQTVTQPIVPTPNPDLERQVMSNLTYRPWVGDKFKFEFIYDTQFENVLGSNWLRWMFDRTLSVRKNAQTTMQYGLNWNHVFSNSSFFDFKLKFLNVHNQDRIELVQNDEFLNLYSDQTNWVDYTGPSNHRVGRPEDDRGDEKIKTYDLNSSFTSQVNKNNLLKAGLQFTYYDVGVNNDVNVYNLASYRQVKFHVYPYEGAFYMQNKMEFEGLIANLGLRLDYYNLNTEYYSNIFSPLRNPYFDNDQPIYLDKGPAYDKNLALKERTKLFARLQPRIGISFPISELSVFHLNYGSFTQRPNFEELFYHQINPNNTTMDIDVLGNPRLKPEKTNTYDIGLVRGFPYGFRLDVSAYYKDVKDLIQTAYYKDSDLNEYRTYINRDYADIKGFHVNLEKITGRLMGYIRYNYETAKGKSSNANDLDIPTTFFEIPDPRWGYEERPFPEDVYLDYDRTHKAIFNVRYRTSSKAGFSIFNFRPLASFSISSTLRITTGRPFTYDNTGQGLKFNRRGPTERDLRLRIEKSFGLGPHSMTFYAEGFNLLNEMFYQYSRTFNDERNTPRWVNDRANILTYNEYEPYVTSQEVYLLRNEPRHYRLGLIFKF